MKPSDSFVDEVRIEVASGNGGNGCVHLRREKFVPLGGPDGGDGGRGGDVVLRADRNLSTLLDYRYRREVRADSGADGRGARKTGADGNDVVLPVPVGTVIFDANAADALPLADLAEDGQCFIAARGGAGGAGNARFATATRQTPDFAKPGRPGESRTLRLTLKLLADAGLVGFPNAGKSTLLRRISSARPRVGAYPFTTLVPSLGVAEWDDRRFVVADIPGLIEGASEGVGLGDRFLRHIERTRVLVHLLDAGAMLAEDRDLLDDYHAIRRELERYSPELAERLEVVAINKVDLLADRTPLEPVVDALQTCGREVILVSGATGENVSRLLRLILRSIDEVDSVLEAEAT
jgi:GTP-binding protein